MKRKKKKAAAAATATATGEPNKWIRDKWIKLQMD